MSSAPPRPFRVQKASNALKGQIRVPGDKSISHRALMLGALAFGQTKISGLLEGEDVLASAAAMRAMGAEITRLETGEWLVRGQGLGALREPEDVLDMGNAGTGARLVMGLVAGHPITATFTGDASLRSRPMGRIITPIKQMGAEVYGRSQGRLPLTVVGTSTPQAITYRLPMASAQVKSAVLLAGLLAAGTTKVLEPVPTRDHSENMLNHFGAKLSVAEDPSLNKGSTEPSAAVGRVISLQGQNELKGADVIVPSDPSSAAFPLVAALLVPHSEIVIENVSTNPLRAGLFAVLKEMGADIEAVNPSTEGGEPVATLRVKHSELKGITVDSAIIPSMIDECPILFVAAAFARGKTIIRNLSELRVKESDRLEVMAQGLKACGVELHWGEDWIEITGLGTDKLVPGQATIKTHLDHRIAMSFAVLSLRAKNPITIDNLAPISTSFPTFVSLMTQLGAEFTLVDGSVIEA